MKVIKQGQLPQDHIHRETCGHCKSELEFKHSEVLWSPDPRDGALWFVICPVCTRLVWGARQMIQLALAFFGLTALYMAWVHQPFI